MIDPTCVLTVAKTIQFADTKIEGAALLIMNRGNTFNKNKKLMLRNCTDI
jgi:hypothetical protein